MPLVTNYIKDVLPFAQVSIHNVMEENLPIPMQDFLNLCGGVPLPSITNLKVDIYATYSSAFTVKIFSDQYETVRSMDFSIGRIDNNYLYVTEKGQGIGTNLFLNQFQAARERGFKRIHLTAMAPYDDELRWNGYYFWACLGFHNSDVEEFHVWAQKMNRKEPTLSALMQTDEGRDFWKATGFTWIGDFFLEGYDCIKHLKAHLQRRGIDFQIN